MSEHLVTLYLHEHLALSTFYILAILVDVVILSVVLITVSIMVRFY